MSRTPDLLVMNARTLALAIRRRSNVQFRFRGSLRLASPHAVGITDDFEAACLVRQYRQNHRLSCRWCLVELQDITELAEVPDNCWYTASSYDLRPFRRLIEAIRKPGRAIPGIAGPRRHYDRAPGSDSAGSDSD